MEEPIGAVQILFAMLYSARRRDPAAAPGKRDSASETMNTAALIVAAGKGTRMGADRPKQYLPLLGRPVLARTLAAFAEQTKIGRIMVVIDPQWRDAFLASTEGFSNIEFCEGGSSRQESVFRGLQALDDDTPPDVVLIHDAARPFISADRIDAAIAAIGPGQGALIAVPVQDSLRRAEGGILGESVDRENLWRAQTPQAFPFRDIVQAHAHHAKENFTDDAALARHHGLKVIIVDGDEDNFKITTPADMRRAERLLLARHNDIRTATGMDVHRFCEGRKLILGGVEIPHDQGLAGHSDADVLLHAATDALLGTIGAGDIGEYFPPSDKRWRDASSDQFIRHAAGLIARRGGVIAHMDLTLVCERPKLSPHKKAIAGNIAHLLELSPERVSLKATTTEELGFTGRGEGIMAIATATVRLP